MQFKFKKERKMNQIDRVLKESKWIEAQDLKKKFKVPKEHYKAFDKLQKDLKDFAPTTEFGGPEIKNFHSLDGSDYAIINFPSSEKRRMYSHMQNKGYSSKVHFPTNSTMQFYFKRR